MSNEKAFMGKSDRVLGAVFVAAAAAAAVLAHGVASPQTVERQPTPTPAGPPSSVEERPRGNNAPISGFIAGLPSNGEVVYSDAGPWCNQSSGVTVGVFLAGNGSIVVSAAEPGDQEVAFLPGSGMHVSQEQFGPVMVVTAGTKGQFRIRVGKRTAAFEVDASRIGKEGPVVPKSLTGPKLEIAEKSNAAGFGCEPF